MAFSDYIEECLGSSGVPVSVTGTTTETTLAQVTAKVGTVEPGDSIEVSHIFSVTNDASSKTLRCYVGSGSTTYVQGVTTIVQGVRITKGYIRNATTTLHGFSAGSANGVGTSTNSSTTGAGNWNSNQNIRLTVALADSADIGTLEAYVIKHNRTPIPTS